MADIDLRWGSGVGERRILTNAKEILKTRGGITGKKIEIKRGCKAKVRFENFDSVEHFAIFDALRKINKKKEHKAR